MTGNNWKKPTRFYSWKIVGDLGNTGSGLGKD
jgi:hypothetical protein